MNEVRWGIIGTGDVSSMIAPDFGLVPGARLSAVCSRLRATAESFGERHGVPHRFDDVDDLLSSGAVDAVYVATPQGTHHDIATRALDAGHHVLIEKPIAVSEQQARDIFQHAETAGLFAMEAMWTKFNPMIAGLREAIEQGVIGDVRSVRASFGVPFPRGVGSRWSADLGGSTLLDQGIYAVTLTTMFLGELEGVAARAVAEAGVDVTVRACLEYSGGRFAQIAASAVEFIDLSASINGTSGWIAVAAPFWAGNSFTIHPGAAALAEGERRDFEIEGAGFAPMLRAATDAILAGGRSVDIHDSAQTLTTLRQLDTIRGAWAPV